MFELGLPSTGQETIDSLQRAQLQAETLAGPQAKMRHMQETVQSVGSLLLGEQLVLTAQNFFIKEPDAAPSQRLVIPHEMFLVARLESYNYLYDPDFPMDSLILALTEPDSIELDGETARDFHQTTVQVPILYINECAVA